MRCSVESLYAGPSHRPDSRVMSERAAEGSAATRCTTCYGSGEIGTDNGPTVCHDCFGEGRQLDSLERTEWRLRDIERATQAPSEHAVELRWLVFVLRCLCVVLLLFLLCCLVVVVAGG